MCGESCVHFHMSSIDLQIPRFNCGITVFSRGLEKSVFLLPGLLYKQFQTLLQLQVDLDLKLGLGGYGNRMEGCCNGLKGYGNRIEGYGNRI